MAGADDFAYLDWPGPIPFAHRGGASEVPENTHAGLRARRRASATATSRPTCTSPPTACCSPSTTTSSTASPTAPASSASCRGRWCARRGSTASSRSRCSRTCSAPGPTLRVNIDPKHDAAVEPLADVAAPVRRRRPGVRRRLQRRPPRPGAGRCCPGVCTSLGPVGSLQLGLAADRARTSASSPAPCAQVPPSYGDTEVVTEAFVDEAHRRGMQVHVWTIDDAAEMARLLDLGVDGIMTDRPAVLKEVLAGPRPVVRVTDVKLPLTPLDFLARARRLFPDRVGVVQGDDVRFDLRRVRRPLRRPGPAAASTTLGVQPGRPGGLPRRQHPPAARGATTACCSPAACCCRSTSALAAPSWPRCLADAGAAVLVRDPSLPRPRLRRPDLRPRRAGARRPTGAVEPPPVDEDAPAELFYTSGSTGAAEGRGALAPGPVPPRRAQRPHQRHHRRRRAAAHDPAVPRQRLGHAHFLTGLGGVHVMLPRFDAAEVLRLVERERVTRLFLVPTMARLAARLPRRRRRATCRRCARCRSAARRRRPSCWPRSRTRFGCEAICGYGMTESSPTLTRSLDKPGTPASRAAAGDHRPADPRRRPPGARRRRRRGAVGRRHRRRDLRPVEPRDDRLLEPARGDRRRRCGAGGCAPATSPSSTPTATSRSSTAARTSSCPAARTSRRSRSRRALLRPPGGARGGRRRHARRAVGRGAGGVRRAARRARRRPRTS